MPDPQSANAVLNAPLAASARPVAAPAGRAVLIVDDEEMMRQFTAEVVRRSGYTALVAGSGPEGLELWAARRDEIGVVLTDMHMPELNGLELARRLRAEPTPPPVIVMTGNADARVRAALGAGEFLALVAKPFSVEALQLALAGAFARR